MKIVISLLKIIFCCIAVQLFFSLAVVAAEELGRVSGRIDCRETPGCPGIAVLWEKDVGAVPDPRRFMVPPGVVSPLHADGGFELEAPPGNYYVGAFLRTSPGPKVGPPRIGDLIYLTPNPAGEAQEVTVVAGRTADAGIHREAWAYGGMTDPADTGIIGQILDMKSQPVAGLLVFAFADADLSSSPQAVSNRTDADGRFILPLAKPGIVYLRTRNNYQGGQPLPGDYVGVFGGAVPKALSVTKGRIIKGVRIQVLQIPEVMNKKNSAGTSRPKFLN